MSHQFTIMEMVTRINVRGFRLHTLSVQLHRSLEEKNMQILNMHVDAK